MLRWFEVCERAKSVVWRRVEAGERAEMLVRWEFTADRTDRTGEYGGGI